MTEFREPSDHDRLASVDLNLLVPLLALLEEVNVTEAARRVGVSQPAMSHALARMRRVLGDELLVRNGGGMVLTPRAAELILPLRTTLRHASRVLDLPDFDPAHDDRVVTVALTSTTGLVFGRPLSRFMAEEAPGLVLRFRSSSMTSETVFTDEGVDVALLADVLASPHPRERLYSDQWVLVVDAVANPDGTATEILSTRPHVMFDSASQRIVPYATLDEEHVQYAVQQRVSDFLLIPHLVAGSDSVAVVQRRVAEQLEAPLGLRILPFPFPTQNLGIDMVWNPRLADDAFKTWFRDALRRVARLLKA